MARRHGVTAVLLHDIEVRVYRSAIKIPVIFFVPAAFIATLYSLIYLYVNSNFFQETLLAKLDGVFPGTIVVEEIVVGPTLLQARIMDGVLTAPDGTRVITLERARANLDFTGLLVRRLELYDLVVDQANVQMTMSKDPEGTFDLLEALGVGGDDEDDESEGALSSIVLRNVKCNACSYGLNIHFFRVDVPVISIPQGDVSISKILQISVPELHVPDIFLEFQPYLFGFPPEKGPWKVHVEDANLRRWVWMNEGFNVEYLGLRAAETTAWASGDMRFPGDSEDGKTQMLYRGEGQVHLAYQSGLIHYFLEELLHVDVLATIAVEGTLEEIQGRFRLASEVLEAQGIFIEDLNAEGYLLDDVVVGEKVTARLHGGTVELDRLMFSMFEGIWAVQGKLDRVDPEGLLGDLQMEYPWLGGQARAGITAMGWIPFGADVRRPGDDPVKKRLAQSQNPMVWLHLDEELLLVRNSREILPGPRLRIPRGTEIRTTQEAAILEDVPVSLDDATARVQNFRFNWKTGFLEQGPLKGPARLRLNTDDLPGLLSHYGVNDVRGGANLEFTMAGRMNYPDVDFKASWFDSAYFYGGTRVDLEPMQVQGRIRSGQASFESFTVNSGRGKATLQGSIDVLNNPEKVIDPKTGKTTGEFLFATNPRMDIQYDVAAVEAAFFDTLLGLGTNIKGRLDAQGEVTGRTRDPKIAMDGKLTDGVVLDQPVDEVDVRGVFSSESIQVDHLQVDAGRAGMLNGRGQASLRNETFSFEAQGKELDFSLWNPLTTRVPLPIEGTGQFEIHGDGSFLRPQIAGYAIADGLSMDGRQVGQGSVVINTLADAIHVVGALPSLGGLAMEWPLDPDSPLYGKLVLNRLNLKNTVREIQKSPIVDDAEATGTIEVFVSRDFERNQILLNLNELRLETLGRTFRNDGPVIVGLNDGSLIQIQQARIGTEGRFVELEGGVFLDEALLDIAARGELDLALLNSFRVSFPEYFPDSVVDASGRIELDTSLRGTPGNLVVDGYIKILPSQIQLRDISTPLVLTSGTLAFGRNGVTIDQDNPVRGRTLDGMFEVVGGVGLVGTTFQDLDIRLRSVNMSYRIPEVASLTFGSDVQLRAQDLTRPETWLVTGIVDVVDGLYYESMSVFQQQFTNRLLGAFSRTSKVYEASIVERIPLLADVSFDLQIRARDSFRIKSEIDRLGLDLELRLDVKLQNTLLNPRIQGGVDIIDGRVQFQNEAFQVRSGTLFFDGDPGNPRVDIVADADIANRCRQADLGESTQSTFRLSGTVGNEDQQNYRVSLNITGSLSNLDIRFESNPYADQRDVLSLILTGCTVDQLTASSASSPTLEVALAPVLGWIEGTVQDVVAVEEFTITPSVDRLRTSIGDRITRRLSWRLEVDTGLTQSTGGQRYELNYKISDSWSAELSESTRTEDDSFVLDFKLKYRILLD